MEVYCFFILCNFFVLVRYFWVRYFVLCWGENVVVWLCFVLSVFVCFFFNMVRFVGMKFLFFIFGIFRCGSLFLWVDLIFFILSRLKVGFLFFLLKNNIVLCLVRFLCIYFDMNWWGIFGDELFVVVIVFLSLDKIDMCNYVFDFWLLIFCL